MSGADVGVREPKSDWIKFPPYNAYVINRPTVRARGDEWRIGRRLNAFYRFKVEEKNVEISRKENNDFFL